MPSPPPKDLTKPGIEPRPPALWVDSLPAEAPGKPKNTGVGSQSLLQGNFPIQKSNWGLLHCKGILYQLSYLGSALSAHNPMANLGRSVLSSLFLLHFLFFSPAFLILSSIKACHFLPLPSPSGSLQEVFNKASSYHPNCTF